MSPAASHTHTETCAPYAAGLRVFAWAGNQRVQQPSSVRDAPQAVLLAPIASPELRMPRARDAAGGSVPTAGYWHAAGRSARKPWGSAQSQTNSEPVGAVQSPAAIAAAEGAGTGAAAAAAAAADAAADAGAATATDAADADAAAARAAADEAAESAQAAPAEAAAAAKAAAEAAATAAAKAAAAAEQPKQQGKRGNAQLRQQRAAQNAFDSFSSSNFGPVFTSSAPLLALRLRPSAFIVY